MDIDHLFVEFQGALVGRYSLERELGRGGMGVVYLAREVQLDRPVAIKLLPPQFAADERLKARFIREAQMAARLSHPYIVPIYRVDEIGGFVFYVMSYVEGETLAQRITARGAVPPHEATRIIREVSWALAYAHAQGLVHRDVKPANILLEQGTGRAMVTDFGIARSTHMAGETTVGELLGTPEYMSPEQASGEDLDGRSDLYSLGVTAFYALTGDLPFKANSAQAVLAQHLTKAPPALADSARGVPRFVAVAIDRCLEKDPAMRFATGEELAEALEPGNTSRPDIPVPVRVFLDRRRMMPILVPPLMMIPMSLGLVAAAAAHNETLKATLIMSSIALAAISVPLGVVVYRLRRLLRLGYGPDDLSAALQIQFERKREEFQYEFGAKISIRERVARGIGFTGLGLAVAFFGAAALGLGEAGLAAAGGLSAYFGVIATIVGQKWKRMRTASTPRIASFWQGRGGKWLTKLASFKLGRRAINTDRPTEMAIAMSVEDLFSALPKVTRKALGNVPQIVKELETRARSVRVRLASIDEAMVATRSASTRAVSGEKQMALVADLAATRQRAEQGLADVVSALENVRLDLLRLRAGGGNTESITRDLAAAREVGEGVDRLFEGYREVDDTLKKR